MDQLILKRIWRGGWVLLVTGCFIIAAYTVLPLIYPFIIAWLIAFALNPFVKWMQVKWRMPRWLSVSIALSVSLMFVLTVMTAVITRIVQEIYTISRTIEDYLNAWRDVIISFFENEKLRSFVQTISSLYKNNPNIQESINNNLSNTAQTVTNTVTELVTRFLDSIVRILTSLPNIATIVIVILLAAFFISKDWQRWMDVVTRVFTEGMRKPIRTIFFDLKKALFGYLCAQFMLISITAVIVIIGLLLLQIDYAVTIGLLIGVVDLLPYLGVGAVMVPWIAYCFLSGGTTIGIGLSVLYGIILIARQIMEPKVLASNVGLDPLITLIAMFIGLKLFGVLGLIIGPVTIVLLAAIQRANVFRDLRNYVLTGRR
ncbi:sporulation integral membrane protein YtvI [Paenibacillus sp. 481]|uniref:sporulation integral membrane protein YtvI n=1 Tax=Paenibacillus sp. 481 TaxID=2835869 RepID=UPI001E2824D8|nr:sporulation integral membrane protein YtvI [Paenibacillus sp. 481]UHA72436.1 sporulation integral membrane protein YtvI [Paenibacillus sp. 481]